MFSVNARRFATAALAAVLALAPARAAFAWGDDIHEMVVRLAVELLPEPLRRELRREMKSLLEGATAPDRRADSRGKCFDPAEAPRHYIDIEMTSADFLAAWKQKLASSGSPEGEALQALKGAFVKEYFSRRTVPLAAAEARALFDALPADKAGFVKLVGESEAGWIGTGPYTVRERYDELVLALAFASEAPGGSGVRARPSRDQWAEAARLAGELSHYAADMHMPLHGTVNYKGQLTGNLIIATKDPDDETRHVHVRYEVMTCRAYLAEIERAVRPRLVPARALPRGTTPERLAIRAARASYPLDAEILLVDKLILPGDSPPRRGDGYVRFMQENLGEATARQVAFAAQAAADLMLSASLEAEGLRGPGAAAAAGSGRAARPATERGDGIELKQ